jgi:hypothetical protein
MANLSTLLVVTFGPIEDQVELESSINTEVSEQSSQPNIVRLLLELQ